MKFFDAVDKGCFIKRKTWADSYLEITRSFNSEYYTWRGSNEGNKVELGGCLSSVHLMSDDWEILKPVVSNKVVTINGKSFGVIDSVKDL
jgi:hypothetical protein